MLEFNFDPFPNLETERLLLRKITMEDAEAFFAFRSDPIAMKYLARPIAKSIEDVKELLHKILSNLEINEAINWAITKKGDGDRVIGTIGFFRPKKESFRAEIGYILSREYWRQGLMNEAIQPIISYGFDTMKLHSIEAVVAPENEASQNLLLKNGFVKEGHFIENEYFEGKFIDTAVYSLLKK